MRKSQRPRIAIISMITEMPSKPQPKNQVPARIMPLIVSGIRLWRIGNEWRKKEKTKKATAIKRTISERVRRTVYAWCSTNCKRTLLEEVGTSKGSPGLTGSAPKRGDAEVVLLFSARERNRS